MIGLLIRDLFTKKVRSASRDPQQPANVAVVLQTVLRPSVERAIRSVFAQDAVGTIQLLVGIDKHLGGRQVLDRALSSCPPNITVTRLDLGYSTSVRHGGVHSNHFGGALRTILSFCANSQYVAYLDDDDWYSPNHLSTLLAAIRGRSWAYSMRSFVNPYNLDVMCVDTIENVGPDRGVYANWGGFACPTSLMVDKRAVASILHLWSEAGTARGDAEDRVFFKALHDQFPAYGASNLATANCIIKPEDGSHSIREKLIIASGYSVELLRSKQPHGFERSR